MPVERPHANGAQPSSGASGIHLRERDLGHDRVLGERRRAHEMADRLAVAGEPCRAVRQIAEALLVADRNAPVGAAAEAVDAGPALRGEQGDHVVTGRDERDIGTDALHRTGSLVAEDARCVPGRVGAGGRVEIGVADAAGGKPDEHLPRLGLGEVDLLDDERASELLEDSCADLHGAEPIQAGARRAPASLARRRPSRSGRPPERARHAPLPRREPDRRGAR